MKIHLLINFMIYLVICGSLYSQVDPGTDNIMHAWTFDDGTANDNFGSANGVLMGGATIEEGALVIADSGQYLRLPADIIAINTYNELSVEAWFTIDKDANTDFKMLFFFGDVSHFWVAGCGYFFEAVRPDNKSRVTISNNMTMSPFMIIEDINAPWPTENFVENGSINDGQIHHMVSTLDSLELSLYIDGNYIGTDTLILPNQISVIGIGDAFLGKSVHAVDESLLGSIDEFKIYNKVLSEDEVDFLYKSRLVSVDHINLANNDIKMFPNPVSDQLTISLSDKLDLSGYFVNITNMSGVIVYSEYFNNNEVLINISALHKNEIYNVAVLSIDNEVLATKMILIH